MKSRIRNVLSVACICSSTACQSPPQPGDQSSPCIVTAPKGSTAETEKIHEAEAALTIFGADILRGGVQSTTKQRLEVIYQRVPDSQIACQMLLQLGACMVTEKQAIGKEYIQLLEEKSVCISPNAVVASTTGTQVYIQVADVSQFPAGKSIQLELGDKGFLVPGIENRKGNGVPSLNEVRYYYPSQFNDAKLVKSVLTENGIAEVMLKPLYALPNKPPLEKAFLEVWFSKP